MSYPPGTDAAEEDQFDRAERLEHGLQFGHLATDLARQRRAHPLVIGRPALQVGDAAQDHLLAARQRGLVAESIRRRGNPAREIFLDRLRPRGRDPRRQAGAISRLVKQRLADLGLAVTQENDEVILSAGKGMFAARRDFEFRPAGFLRKQAPVFAGD